MIEGSPKEPGGGEDHRREQEIQESDLLRKLEGKEKEEESLAAEQTEEIARQEQKALLQRRKLFKVRVRGIDYDVFYQFIVYLYTSELRLRDPPDEHVLLGLMLLANGFGLEHLRGLSGWLARRCVTVENVALFLTKAHALHVDNLFSFCMAFILEHYAVTMEQLPLSHCTYRVM
jgi:hypothetical protein